MARSRCAARRCWACGIPRAIAHKPSERDDVATCHESRLTVRSDVTDVEDLVGQASAIRLRASYKGHPRDPPVQVHDKLASPQQVPQQCDALPVALVELHQLQSRVGGRPVRADRVATGPSLCSATLVTTQHVPTPNSCISARLVSPNKQDPGGVSGATSMWRHACCAHVPKRVLHRGQGLLKGCGEPQGPALEP